MTGLHRRRRVQGLVHRNRLADVHGTLKQDLLPKVADLRQVPLEVEMGDFGEEVADHLVDHGPAVEEAEQAIDVGAGFEIRHGAQANQHTEYQATPGDAWRDLRAGTSLPTSASVVLRYDKGVWFCSGRASAFGVLRHAAQLADHPAFCHGLRPVPSGAGAVARRAPRYED